MIYCNAVPIAAATFLGQDVVTDALNTIFLAISDLVRFNKDVILQFGFCNISIVGKALTTQFNSTYVDAIQNKHFEANMKRGTTPVSSIWKTSYRKTFAGSTLGSLLSKPNPEVVQTLNEKTMALKLMSLDMSSSSKLAVRSKAFSP